MSKLAGKVAVVTGGNSGIGLAAAQLFEAEGASVAIFGRNQETLAQAGASLKGNSLAVQGDVSNLADLDKLFAEVKAKYGKLDVLFVNAGIATFVPLLQVDEGHLDQILDVNFKGAFFTIQKAVPLMTDGWSIILNTSIVNQKEFPGTSVYSASKAALRSLARTLSAELVEQGIRVNAVSPGPIETPIFGKMGMSKEETDGFTAGMAQMVPLKRMGRAEEVAKAALFFASDDSSFVVGAELTTDGGTSQL